MRLASSILIALCSTASALSAQVDTNLRFSCPLHSIPVVRPGDAEARTGGYFDADRAHGQHGALDLNATLGDTVYAVRAGIAAVATSTNWGEMGLTVILDHGDGHYTVYGHLSELLTRPNSRVERGAPIGRVGYSGNAQGLERRHLPPHLHFGYFAAGRSGLASQPRPFAKMQAWGDAWLDVLDETPTDLAVGVLDPGMWLPADCYHGTSRVKGNGYRGIPVVAEAQLRIYRERVAAISTYPVSTQDFLLSVERGGLTAPEAAAADAARSVLIRGSAAPGPARLLSEHSEVEERWNRRLATAAGAGTLPVTIFDELRDSTSTAAANPVREMLAEVSRESMDALLATAVDQARVDRITSYQQGVADPVQAAASFLTQQGRDALRGLRPEQARVLLDGLFRYVCPDGRTCTGLEKARLHAGTQIARGAAAANRAVKNASAAIAFLDSAAASEERVAASVARLQRASLDTLQLLSTALAAIPLRGTLGRLRTGAADVSTALEFFNRSSDQWPAMGNADGSVRGLVDAVSRNRDAAATSARGYIAGMGALLDGAAALGLNPQIVERGKSILAKGSAAVSLAQALLSPNPLSALGAVGGLFGDVFGGGPDVAEQRHQELLGRFDRVDQQLAAIQQTQRQILEQLARIEAKLDQLALQVERNHLETLDSLGEIKRLELVNLSHLEWLAHQGEPACRYAVRVVTSARSNHFSYADLASAVSQYQTEIKDCFTYLENQSRARGTAYVGPALWREPPRDDTNEPDFASKVWRPLTNGLWGRGTAASGWIGWARGSANASSEQLVSVFRAPAPDIDSLRAKEANLRAGRWARPPLDTAAFRNPMFAVAVDSASRIARAVVGLHPLLDDASGGLRPESQLRNPVPRRALPDLRPKEEEWLRDWVRVVDAAIAQQVVEGGDLLLPWIASRMKEPGTLYPFRHNGLFLVNLVRYLTYTIPGTDHNSVGPYAFALLSRDSSYLEIFFRPAASIISPMTFKFRAVDRESGKLLPGDAPRGTPHRWVMVLTDSSQTDRTAPRWTAYVPMPTIEEYRAGLFVPSPFLPALERERALLAEELVRTTFGIDEPQAAQAVTLMLMDSEASRAGPSPSAGDRIPLH